MKLSAISASLALAAAAYGHPGADGSNQPPARPTSADYSPRVLQWWDACFELCGTQIRSKETPENLEKIDVTAHCTHRCNELLPWYVRKELEMLTLLSAMPRRESKKRGRNFKQRG